jgi:folate-dependent phosphoribosylglycinamide formyltransferase PurN
MRLLMFGTGPFAAPTFRELFDTHHVVIALVTSPLRPKRGKDLTPLSPMRDIAHEHGIPIFDPENINDPQSQQKLSQYDADLMVVCDYGQILSAETLATTRMGGINLHASLLPKYRGAAPINWAIYHGEKETGVTVIHMVPRVDAGPCIAQASTDIDPEETAVELETRLAELGAWLVRHQGFELMRRIQSELAQGRLPAAELLDGAMVLVGQTAIRSVDAGGNMAAPLLAEVVGGQAFLGFIAAVAFATILAVVAGLTLAGAAALSHDVWVHVFRHGRASEREQLIVARGATIVLAVLSIVLGIAFKGQNVAYMVGLAFAIAASANFPALVLSIFWRPFTTRAAQLSILVGTSSALILIYVSPTIQVDLLHRSSAWFPLRNPGLVTIPLAFAVGIVVSLLAPEPEAAHGFSKLEKRIHLGEVHSA